MASLRGTPIPVRDGHFFLTYDPFVTKIMPDGEEQILWDMQLAERYRTTGTLMPDLGDYQFVKSFRFLMRHAKVHYEGTGKPLIVSVDLETLGLDYISDEGHIICISMTPVEGQSYVMLIPPKFKDTVAYREVRWLLRSPMVKVIGANFKYDMLWMHVKWGIWCTNFKADTLLMGSLLNENRSNSVNSHAKIFTSMGGYDDFFNQQYDKSRMDLVPKKDMLAYAGGDTDAVYRTYHKVAPALRRNRKLARFYQNLTHPASYAFTKMEARGVLVDVDYLLKLRDEVQDELISIRKKCWNSMPTAIKKKYPFSNDMNLQRAAFVKDFMFSPLGLNLEPVMFTPKPDKEDNPVPATHRDHLKEFLGVDGAEEFIDHLIEYGIAAKTYSTYIGAPDSKKGFLNFLRLDQRFHPSYFLFHGADDLRDKGGGTDTGRTSAKDPAIQTLPKHTKYAKALRKAFIAPEGYVVLSADYSQAELRTIAIIAKVKKMLQAYKNGIDLHRVTAADMMGLSLSQFMQLPEEAQKVGRQRAKAVNFGLIFKMSAKGLVEYAKYAYGVSLSLKEAELAHHRFLHESYPEVSAYHKSQAAWVIEHKYVTSPLGRIRHLPLIDSPDEAIQAKAVRNAINSPVQSTASDLTQLAMIEMDYRYKMHFVIMIHDNIVCYAPEDEVELQAARMKMVMESLPLKEKFGWSTPITFEADLEYGPNLGELEEMKI